MAKTIAIARGRDKTRTKEVHRLGSQTAEVQAATWHTFVRAVVNADGSGYISVVQNGKTIHEYTFGPE